MKDFFVSVIIPTYNRANDLDRCLKSLQNQTFKSFEVLVCDDGSTDNTKEIVDKYNSVLTIQYIKDENFGGPARPRNNGIKKIKGNVIAFLDSDDWWYPNKLEVSLINLKNYDLVYHNLDTYKQEDKPNGVMKSRQLNIPNIINDLMLNGGIPNSSVVIKRDIIDKVGFITEDKKFIAVEDSDYIIRIAQITNKFKFIDKSLGGYWIGNNISVSEKQIDREQALYDKHNYLLNSTEKVQALQLLSLKKARVYHKLSEFSKAQSQYQIAFRSTKISFKIKSIIGFLSSQIKIKI